MQNKVRNGYYFTSKDKIWNNNQLPKMWGKCNTYVLPGKVKISAVILESNLKVFSGGQNAYRFILQIPSCV